MLAKWFYFFFNFSFELHFLVLFSILSYYQILLVYCFSVFCLFYTCTLCDFKMLPTFWKQFSFYTSLFLGGYERLGGLWKSELLIACSAQMRGFVTFLWSASAIALFTVWLSTGIINFLCICIIFVCVYIYYLKGNVCLCFEFFDQAFGKWVLLSMVSPFPLWTVISALCIASLELALPKHFYIESLFGGKACAHT